MPQEGTHFRFYLLLLLVTIVPLFSLGLTNHGLWTPDEARVAEIGREMALSGNWAVPTLNQKRFLEEPPLYYGSLATVFKAFGASDGAARIPSALFAFGGVLTLFFLGAMLFTPRVGFLGAFIMATGAEYFRVAHWVIVDSALTCFVLLALTFFVSAYRSKDRMGRLLFYTLCYVSCTFAFYVKGFIGVVIPGLAVFAFLLFRGDLRELLRMHLWLAAAIFIAATLPWFLALYRQGGADYLGIFFIHNHLGRFAGGSTGHHQPFYYYLLQFPGGFMPWSLLVVPVFYRGFRHLREGSGASKEAVLFLLCWFIAGFVFLSAASTKRILYLMPIFAPVALLTGSYIDGTLRGAGLRRFETFFALFFDVLLLAVGLAAIPLLFYAARAYGFALPFAQAAWTAVFSLAAVVLSSAALLKYNKDKGRFWTFSGASVVSLFLLAVVAAVPLLDTFKTFVPFCSSVKAAVPPSAALYAYRPDETLRGAVPFYTGHFMADVHTLSEVQQAIDREHPVFVVIRDRKGELERELLSTGRLRVAARQDMDGRGLVLFTSAPVQKP